MNAEKGIELPSERIYIAADTCVLMRNELHAVERQRWSDEVEGLFQMVAAFMRLFKQMYVP